MDAGCECGRLTPVSAGFWKFKEQHAKIWENIAGAILFVEHQERYVFQLSCGSAAARPEALKRWRCC